MTEQIEGQMTIWDFLDQDSWSGKTSPEPSLPTKEKTSDAYSKKFAELRIKMPQYLCLQKGDGQQADASWEMGGALLGEYTMHSFGESPKDVRESLLSQILVGGARPKYYLSARACKGILNRAERRNKKLPEMLEKALKAQSASLNEQGVMGGVKESSYNMSEQEPSEPPTTTESLIGSNWDGGQISPTLTVKSDQQRMPDKQNFNAVLTYGFDRATYNQGQNAKFGISIEEEKIGALVAKGPGGGLQQTSDRKPLCKRL